MQKLVNFSKDAPAMASIDDNPTSIVNDIVKLSLVRFDDLMNLLYIQGIILLKIIKMNYNNRFCSFTRF